MLVTEIFFLSSSCFLSVNNLISFYNRVIEWFASEGTFKDHSVQPRLSGPTLWSVLISLVTSFSFNFFLSFLVSCLFLVFAIWSLPHLEFALTSFPNTTQRSNGYRSAYGNTKIWCSWKHWNLGKKFTKKDNCYYPACGKYWLRWERGEPHLPSAPHGVSCYIILHCWCEKGLLHCTWVTFLFLFFANQFKVSCIHLFPSLSFFPHRLFEAFMMQCFPKIFSHLDNYMQKK